MNKRQSCPPANISGKQFTQQVIDLATRKGWLVDVRCSILIMVKAGRVIIAVCKSDRQPFERALTPRQRALLDALEACLGVEVYRWKPQDMPVITELLSIKFDTESVLAAVKRGVAKGLSLTIEKVS
jgi:hypothetical protein